MAGLLDAATGVLVDGKWRSGGAVAPVRDKFTQLPAAEVRLAREADSHDAVTSAAAAARRPLPPAQRHQILSEAARLLAANAAEVTANYIAETGFTKADAAAEFARATSTLRLSAEEAVRIAERGGAGRGDAGQRENRLAFTIRVPCGVVVAIAPFNAPLNTVAHKIGPALAAGNAVVRKAVGRRHPPQGCPRWPWRRSCSRRGCRLGLPSTWCTGPAPPWATR